MPQLIGQTEVLSNTKNLDWARLFYIEDFELGKATSIIVILYNLKNSAQPIGSHIFVLSSMIAAKGNTIAKELKDGSIILAHIDQAIALGILQFQLHGLYLLNAEGFGLMTRMDPFFELQRLRELADGSGKKVWDAVFWSPRSPTSLIQCGQKAEWRLMPCVVGRGIKNFELQSTTLITMEAMTRLGASFYL